MKQLSCIVLLVLVAAAPATKPVAKPAFAASVREEIKKALDELQSSADFAKAEAELQQIFDQTIAYSLAKDADVIRDADYALRLVHQVQSIVDKDRRLELFKFLRGNESLSRTLTFLIIPKQDP